jgi:hypothetical protein
MLAQDSDGSCVKAMTKQQCSEKDEDGCCVKALMMQLGGKKPHRKERESESLCFLFFLWMADPVRSTVAVVVKKISTVAVVVKNFTTAATVERTPQRMHRLDMSRRKSFGSDRYFYRYFRLDQKKNCSFIAVHLRCLLHEILERARFCGGRGRGER